MRPVLLSACRTPIGKFLGGLSALAAPDLGAIVIREAVQRAGLLPTHIDEVIMGNVLSAGVGQAPARQAALRAGLPPEVAAFTINKMCGSGLKAVMLAAQAVKAGDANAIVAGGMESMSQAPHLLAATRTGWKIGDRTVVDSMQYDGLHCAMEDRPMGGLAEDTARTRDISRVDQDDFSRTSHRRACQAAESGDFAEEIIPVMAPSKRGTERIALDEGIRSGVTPEDLARLNPNSEVKKHRFVRKAVAERGCNTKSNLNPRTKQCIQSFTRFSVPAKFNSVARPRQSPRSGDWSA